MKLLSIGNYGLHVMQFPSLKWGYVGSVPEILCKEEKTKLGLPVMNSLLFDNQEDAIKYFEDRKNLIS